MSKKEIKELKKIISDNENNNNEVVSKLLDIIEDLEKTIEELTTRCSDLEEDIEAINEDMELLTDGMHMEDYDPILDAVCPYCNADIEINLDEVEGQDEFKCPECGKAITLEWDSVCDCGGDCDGDCDGCDDDNEE
ncbi:MAG: hypothetical protein IJS47_05710 [Clostridia bacterium]|nr:hypothetical protein [Clostridia bacterium]